ncbi:WD repeat-containing protein 43 [Palaemon carinicauda]|uniref:WD repeat-containing protein 43 n=1 Tax=Palaemon carinicauda TaxID=392227 RepID=UPI0035B60548
MTKSKLVSFTPDGGKLAHSGPDGVLRIWDTTSGVLEHEYQPAEHLKATTSCIKYSPKPGKNKASHCLLAMGTLAGTILLYSPEESEVKATFEHSSHQAVTDIAWFSSDKLVSLGTDGTIIMWDIETGNKNILDQVCEGNTICLFGKKMIAVGNRKIQVLLRQDSGKVKVKNNFTGHLSPVTQLLKIRMKEKTTAGHYFLSSSLDDRFIYAWSTSSSDDTPLCSFMVNDTVTNMAVGELSNNTLALSATTRKGALVLFTHHLNGNKGKKAVKNTGSLQICSMSNDKKSVIPIVASHFCNDSEPSIIIVYNRSSVFTFERVPLERIVGEQEFIRAEPSSGKGVSLLKTLVPTVPDEATLVGPLHCTPVEKGKAKRKRGDDNVASLPMEERLNVLALDTTGTQGTSFSGTDDFAQILLQGLHSKDQNILRNIFDGGDVKAINKTVRRLPVQAVVPLLEQLAVAIMGKGHKNANHVKWVRSVLYHHMSHLTTVPDRQKLMQPFFNISAARMSTFSQVTQLHARLDLILTHVAARQQEVKQKDAEPEALLVYRDESSDEDDMMDTMIGISESEDNWDELSDIDRVNGPTDEESEMETEPKSGAVKRKLVGKDVNGEDSDVEDEEESSDDESEEENDKNADDDDDDSENSNADMNGEDNGSSDSEE